MLKLNAKRKFYGIVILSAIAIMFIHLTAEVPKTSVDGEFSSLLEKVRTLGIKERMTEVRRIRTNSRWLKSDLSELIGYLELGQDNRGEPLTINQQISAIESIESAGREASGATSVIQKILAESESVKKKKVLLLTMIRIKSAEESVLESLNHICTLAKNDADKELCLYRPLVKYRFGIAQELNDKNHFDELKTDLSTAIEKLVPDEKEVDSDFANHSFSETEDEIFFKSSLIGSLNDKAKNALYSIATSTYPTEKRIIALKTLLDQLELSDELIMKISELMQYDNKYEIREAALLGLSRIDSEKGLTQVHAYGHKFLYGEPRPSKIEPHPFIKWVLNKKEE